MDEDVEMFVGRKAARTFYPSMVGKFAGLVITVLTYIAFAKLLGTSNFGLFTLAVGYAALIGAVNNFGIASYFTKVMSELSFKRDAKGLAAEVVDGFAVLVPVAIVISLLGLLFSGYIANVFLNNTHLEQTTLLIISVDLFFDTIWGSSYQALMGLGEGRKAGVSLTLVNAFAMVSGVALLFLGYGVNGAISGILIGDVVGLVVTSYYLYKALLRFGKVSFPFPKISKMKLILVFALPLAAINLFGGGVTNFATLLLGKYATNAIVGNYGIAILGYGALVIVYDTLAIVLLQAFSAVLTVRRVTKNVEITYNNAIFYSLLLTVPAIIFIGVFSQPIVYLFLGRGGDWSVAPTLLTLITIGSVFSVIIANTKSFYIASGKVKELLMYTLITAITELVALFILVPSMQAVGVIVALFYVGNLVSAALHVIDLKRIFGMRIRFRRVLNLLASDLVLVMFLSFVLLLNRSVLELVVGFFAILLLYPPLLAVFNSVDKQSLLNLRAHVEKIPVVEVIAGYLATYTNIFIDIFEAERKR